MLFLTYCYSLATSDLPESIRYLSIYSFGMHWVSSTSTRDINYPLNKFCDKMQKAELPLVFSGWICEDMKEWDAIEIRNGAWRCWMFLLHPSPADSPGTIRSVWITRVVTVQSHQTCGSFNRLLHCQFTPFTHTLIKAHKIQNKRHQYCSQFDPLVLLSTYQWLSHWPRSSLFYGDSTWSAPIVKIVLFMNILVIMSVLQIPGHRQGIKRNWRKKRLINKSTSWDEKQSQVCARGRSISKQDVRNK